MPMFNLFGNARKPEKSSNSNNSAFLTEFAEDNLTFNNYTSKGILLDNDGDKLKLSYTGILSKSGAPDVYAVVGYGDNKAWDETKSYRMNKNGRGTFEVLLPVKNNVNINVAFKDGSNNWDNNFGQNYSFYTH